MTKTEKARFLRKFIEKAAQQGLEDSDAIEAVDLYPNWKADTAYIIGVRIKYEGILYKVLQNHTSQSNWTPDITPSLYVKVLIPEPDQTPEWEQPDSTNPYMIGDRVTHNGFTWESDVDNNVWEPGVYGWHKVEE